MAAWPHQKKSLFSGFIWIIVEKVIPLHSQTHHQVNKKPFQIMMAAMLLFSCSQKQERVVTPYGSVLDSVTITEDFDLQAIQTSGELIMATLSGPETYYDYHGKSLGTLCL